MIQQDVSSFNDKSLGIDHHICIHYTAAIPVSPNYIFYSTLLMFLLLSISDIHADSSNLKPFSAGYIYNIVYGVDQQDAKVATKILTDKILGESFPGRESQSTFYDSVEAASKAYRKGELDLLTMLSTDYLRIQDEIKETPVAVGSIGGKAEVKYILLVKKNSGIASISQLKNKTLNICKGGTDVIGTIWMDDLLMRNGYNVSTQFFGSINKVNKPTMAILPVFFEICF